MTQRVQAKQAERQATRAEQSRLNQLEENQYRNIMSRLEKYTETPMENENYYTPQYFKKVYDELLDAAETNTVQRVIEDNRPALEKYRIIGGRRRRSRITKKCKTAKRTGKGKGKGKKPKRMHN
jgi:hypothetical protein